MRILYTLGYFLKKKNFVLRLIFQNHGSFRAVYVGQALFHQRRVYILDWTLGVIESPKPVASSRFRFIGVYWERVVRSSSRMRNVVSHSAYRSFVPLVNDVENQWRVDLYRWVQGRPRLPRFVLDSGDEFSLDTLR